MADLVLLLGGELSEGLLVVGRHEERIVAEAFGADFGVEDLAPALAHEFTDFLVGPEEDEVALEARAALMERRFLHGLEQLGPVLGIGRSGAGIDRGVDAWAALQGIATKAAVVRENPGFLWGDLAESVGLQAAVTVKGAGDFFDIRHASEVLC